MAEISKLSGVAIADVAKVDAVTKANIANINDLTIPSAAAFLLDTYTGAAAAYSVRRLNSLYTGACMRVRRSSDNTEQDIGFDSNGDLDTSALATFVGSGNNGFVRYWYDQSTSGGTGSGNDAGQATAGSQPQIYNGTAVITDNGKPAIKWDGSNDYLETPSYDDWSDGELMFSMVLSNPGLGTTMWDIENGVMRYSIGTPTQQFFLPYPSQDTVRVFSVPSSQYLVTCYYDGTENAVYNDGTEMGTVTTSNTIGDQNVTGILGSRVGTSQFSTMYCQELIHYPFDQSSNRTGIETDINDYFSIY